MKAEIRDRRRREAIEKAKSRLSTPEEREALWKGVQRMMSGLRGRLSAKQRREQALKIYQAQLEQLERDKDAASHKVQLLGPTDRLVIPRSSVLITPEEARRMEQMRR